MKRIILIPTVFLFATPGCVVGPDYQRPDVPQQAGWKENNPARKARTLPTNWWKVFNDGELNSLEAQAVSANQDLTRAAARVTEARALARLSRADLSPKVSGGGGYSRNRQSENLGGGTPHDATSDHHSASFDLSYELDLWGRVRRGIEASQADAAAVTTDFEVVRLTLTADVARNYFRVRSLDEQKGVVQATIDLRKAELELQETRSEAGLINETDVTLARTELANVEAELQEIVRSRAEVEHALAVLCGKAPADFSVAARGSIKAPPEIPAGLPSSLMQRRPDIVEAEQLLEAASARIGVAEAAFFPTIKLTGSAGVASADLGSFFSGSSRAGSLGPQVSVPILDGGANKANLKAAEARYEQSLASYRGTILNAFREVEDALSELGTLSSQSEAIDRALASSRDTVKLASERYEQGLSSYLEVVDAQRAALQAERELAQLRGERAISTVLLVKALGGGWDRSQSEKLMASN